VNDTLDVKTAHQEDPPTWAEKHFGEVDLSDPRRNRRAVTIATAMATNPDRSIPQMFLNTYDIKAAYKRPARRQKMSKSNGRAFVIAARTSTNCWSVAENSTTAS